MCHPPVSGFPNTLVISLQTSYLECAKLLQLICHPPNTGLCKVTHREQKSLEFLIIDFASGLDYVFVFFCFSLLISGPVYL